VRAKALLPSPQGCGNAPSQADRTVAGEKGWREQADLIVQGIPTGLQQQREEKQGQPCITARVEMVFHSSSSSTTKSSATPPTVSSPLSCSQTPPVAVSSGQWKVKISAYAVATPADSDAVASTRNPAATGSIGSNSLTAHPQMEHKKECANEQDTGDANTPTQQDQGDLSKQQERKQNKKTRSELDKGGVYELDPLLSSVLEHDGFAKLLEDLPQKRALLTPEILAQPSISAQTSPSSKSTQVDELCCAVVAQKEALKLFPNAKKALERASRPHYDYTTDSGNIFCQ